MQRAGRQRLAALRSHGDRPMNADTDTRRSGALSLIAWAVLAASFLFLVLTR